VEPIDFEDLESLNAAASSEFGPWGKEVLISQELVDAFADLTGDQRWIYVDVERCRAESPFGVPIAPDFLVLSLMHQSVPRPIEVKGHSSGINYGARRVRFLSPVAVGCSIRARCRLVRAEAVPRGTLITAQVEVAVVGREDSALHYDMQVLYL